MVWTPACLKPSPLTRPHQSRLLHFFLCAPPGVFGLPLPILPRGFHVRACLVIASFFLLRVWPILLHFLPVISMVSSLVPAHRPTFPILSRGCVLGSGWCSFAVCWRWSQNLHCEAGKRWVSEKKAFYCNPTKQTCKGIKNYNLAGNFRPHNMPVVSTWTELNGLLVYSTPHPLKT